MTMSFDLTQYKYGSFAERYLTDVQPSSGAEVLSLCPFHDDHSPSFQFNVDKGLYICFSCGARGSIRGLERRFGVSHRSVGVGLDVVYTAIERITAEDEQLSMRESQLSSFAIPTDLWHKRGFTDETIAQFDLGYDVFRDAMTIPLRTMNRDLMGVCRRYMDPGLKNRYRYPKGFHRSAHLFASWLVADMPKTPPVVVTEGAVDTMTIWQAGTPAVAVYGSSIAMSQVRQMRMLGIHEITLCFDKDKAGRDATSRALGWQRDVRGKWERKDECDLRRWFRVRTVDWRSCTEDAKDANDLSTPALTKLLADARLVG